MAEENIFVTDLSNYGNVDRYFEITSFQKEKNLHKQPVISVIYQKQAKKNYVLFTKQKNNNKTSKNNKAI